jgi:hypothetical protein
LRKKAQGTVDQTNYYDKHNSVSTLAVQLSLVDMYAALSIALYIYNLEQMMHVRSSTKINHFILNRQKSWSAKTIFVSNWLKPCLRQNFI